MALPRTFRSVPFTALFVCVWAAARIGVPAAGADTVDGEFPGDPDDGPSLAELRELEASGAVIGEVTYRIGDIFDPTVPEENRKLFRAANRLHRETRPRVIEDLLLFRPGDRFSLARLDESERLLRASHLFDDPVIRVVRVAGGTVDLAVETSDLWTLKGGAGVGRSGGVNSTHFQIEDTNVLGTGRTIELERSSDVDRTSSVVHYRDPDLFDRRLLLDAAWSDNSDGSTRSLRFERPFLSLDSRWAAGAGAREDDRVDSLYELGHVVSAFRHDEERFDLYAGWAPGACGLDEFDSTCTASRASRFSAGLAFERHRFTAADATTVPGTLPEDRTISAPFVAYDNLGRDFAKTRNFDQLGRTEDVALGWRLHAKLGASLRAFGATADEAVFEGLASWGLRSDEHPGRTLLLSGGVSGRYGADGARNALASLRARGYLRDFGDQLFLVSLELDAAQNLDPERQLLLGGDSGLRGYPLRYQAGDLRALLSIEQRLFTDWYPFRLFRVGAAAFVDVGEVWISSAPTGASRGLLRDVGVGLRLGSTRSSLGSLVHLDVAFPLDGDGSIDRVQFLVSTRAGF